LRVTDYSATRSAERARRLATAVPHPVELISFLHDRRLVRARHVEASGGAEVEDGAQGFLADHLGPDARVAGDGQRHAPEVLRVVRRVVHFVFRAVLQDPDVADLLRVERTGEADGKHAAARAGSVVEAGPVNAVGRFRIADATVVGQGAVRAIEGFGAAVVPHAVDRPILENERAVGQVRVEVGSVVEDGSSGLGAGDARPVDPVGGLREADAPVGAVDARASSESIGSAVIQLVDVAVLECAHGEVAALVELCRASQSQHGAAGTRSGNLLPFERREASGARRTAQEEQRGEDREIAQQRTHRHRLGPKRKAGAAAQYPLPGARTLTVAWKAAAAGFWLA